MPRPRAYEGEFSQERLREALSYDPSTGVFRWKIKCAQRVSIGDIAGSPNVNGYLLIMLDRVRYKAHRLAWFYVHGYWPPEEVDHINGIRSDNRFDNLRCVTRAINMTNKGSYKNSTTGFKGVHFHKRGQRYIAHIQLNGKRRHLGSFLTAEDARLAYLAAAREAFGHSSRTS
jgi:HNH endonuclease/AP2 domain